MSVVLLELLVNLGKVLLNIEIRHHAFGGEIVADFFSETVYGSFSKAVSNVDERFVLFFENALGAKESWGVNVVKRDGEEPFLVLFAFKLGRIVMVVLIVFHFSVEFLRT